MKSVFEDAFKKNTTYKKTRSFHEITCNKSLWAVCSLTKAQAEREARHYFAQYYADGEYDK